MAMAMIIMTVPIIVTHFISGLFNLVNFQFEDVLIRILKPSFVVGSDLVALQGTHAVHLVVAILAHVGAALMAIAGGRNKLANTALTQGGQSLLHARLMLERVFLRSPNGIAIEAISFQWSLAGSHGKAAATQKPLS